MKQGNSESTVEVAQGGGLAGWLLRRLRATRQARVRRSVLERIQLAPRQSLAMIEADGRVLLVATSPEGATAFYPLDEPRRHLSYAGQPGSGARPLSGRAARISW